ncbi:unnamed protein product [Cylicostephanus goldi]|uniref:Uncharacterized protein n=1 Tax=Cylicostephanus goldi TaxID=71465 RepID=A0A3P7MB20_CYLGO|nr:unnamed protein product [Cylicostephanus goldi]
MFAVSNEMVQIEYKSDAKVGEYQLVRAKRPAEDKAFENPDETMRELELQIKKEMLIAELLKTRRKLTKEEQEILDEEIPLKK